MKNSKELFVWGSFKVWLFVHELIMSCLSDSDSFLFVRWPEEVSLPRSGKQSNKKKKWLATLKWERFWVEQVFVKIVHQLLEEKELTAIVVERDGTNFVNRMENPEEICIEELSRQRDSFAPYTLSYFKCLETTQKFLLEHEGPVTNNVCVSELQTRGRCRNKDVWDSPFGGLTFSIKLATTKNLVEFAPHICALSVALALDKTIPHPVQFE